MAVSLLSFSSAFGQPAQGDSPSLGEAFNAGAPEVEPVVVGRESGMRNRSKTIENSGDPLQQTESSSNSNDLREFEN